MMEATLLVGARSDLDKDEFFSGVINNVCIFNCILSQDKLSDICPIPNQTDPDFVEDSCSTPINFYTWEKKGYSESGKWAVEPGGESVNQLINGLPTFFVGPDTFINVRISGSI